MSVTLCGTRDFVAVNNVRLLTRGSHPGLPRRAQCIHRVLSRGRQEGRVRAESDVMTKAEVGMMFFEDKGARSQGMQVATRSWRRLGNGSPREPSGRTSPANILNLASAVKLILDFLLPEL